jgi:ribose-phosphate pyrophosphokinase
MPSKPVKAASKSPSRAASNGKVARPSRTDGFFTSIPSSSHQPFTTVNLPDTLKIFAGSANKKLTEGICSHIGLPVGRARVDSFPDGELIVKLDEDVRGRDCFVVQSTSTPVNENLMELLIWIDCLKRASADRITAVLPYFGYARQDRKSEGRTPITAKLVSNLITAAGADRVLSMDLHAPQLQGFFDIPMDHLLAAPVLSKYFVDESPKWGKIAIVSPDPGNLKAASYYAELINADLAFIDKRRQTATSVEMNTIVGNDIRGKTVLMVDDMITTGGTITEASRILKENGAAKIVVAATHGVFAGSAVEKILKSPIDRIIITDTIPMCDRLTPIMNRLTVLSVTSLMGEAIKRIHLNQSVSAVLKGAQAGKR